MKPVKATLKPTLNGPVSTFIKGFLTSRVTLTLNEFIADQCLVKNSRKWPEDKMWE